MSELPKRLYLYGPSGSGKTRKAVEMAKAVKDLLYRKRCSRFWNDYRGQKVVLIDNLDKEDVQYIKNYIGDWIDYYPFEGKLSGEEKTHIEINPIEYTFIITSYIPMADMFDKYPENLKAKIFRIFEEQELKIEEKESSKFKSNNTVNPFSGSN